VYAPPVRAGLYRGGEAPRSIAHSILNIITIIIVIIIILNIITIIIVIIIIIIVIVFNALLLRCDA
jgi:hypothetical protein